MKGDDALKKELKVSIIVITILVIISIIVITMINSRTPTYRAVVVKVDENSMIVEGINDGLVRVGFTENIGFKPNQEVLIYYDGMMLTTYPGQLSHVTNIKIVKEKSETEVSKQALLYCYSSKDNVDITVSEITNKGISLKIKDTNEIPYEYSHYYTLSKRIKNPDYTGIGYKIGEDTENSTAGYTRNRTRVYMARSGQDF